MNNDPLSFKNIISGIIVTVIGGIFLFLILEGSDLWGKDSEAPPESTSTPEQVINWVSPIPPTVTDVPVCKEAPEKRLSVGTHAVICTKSDPVRMRTTPSHSADLIDSLMPGVELVVIGGPVCDETNSWWYWEVRTEDGFTGWVSEGGDAVDAYYVCPVE